MNEIQDVIDGKTRWRVECADCLSVLPGLPDCCVDAVVTDPPAGISFMGKKWDGNKGGRDSWIAWMRQIAEQCLRVLKPGGHAIVWALPRTSHWTATAWENAGFEVRDRVAHLFGSGFPKSLNVSKAIKYTREMTTKRERTGAATEAAKQWDGWGTALKPAIEDYWLFQKPIDLMWYSTTINMKLGKLEKELCKLNAKHAAKNLPRIQADKSAAMTDSVLASVQIHLGGGGKKKTATGEAEDSKEATGTLLSTSAAHTCLSIVASWKNILADCLALMNTFTTATEKNLTTDLKILNYWTSQITAASMLQAALNQNGQRSFVDAVENLFRSALAKSQSIQTLSALSSVTNKVDLRKNLAVNLPLDEYGQSLELSPDGSDWWLLRKPLEGTVTANVLKHGTGGINVDGCRIGFAEGERESLHRPMTENKSIGWKNTSKAMGYNTPDGLPPAAGRWPANVTLDEEAAMLLDEASGDVRGAVSNSRSGKPSTICFGNFGHPLHSGRGDSGGASRFFYVAKATSEDRGHGNNHPTVKSLPLMIWLSKLVCRDDGLILDPFCGSGSGGVAAQKIGMRWLGFEIDPTYAAIARKRIANAMPLFASVVEPTPEPSGLFDGLESTQ